MDARRGALRIALHDGARRLVLDLYLSIHTHFLFRVEHRLRVRGDPRLGLASEVAGLLASRLLAVDMFAVVGPLFLLCVCWFVACACFIPTRLGGWARASVQEVGVRRGVGKGKHSW